MGLANGNLFPKFGEIWLWLWGLALLCGNMHQSITDALVVDCFSYFAPGIRVKYCDEYVCLSLYLSACITQQTTFLSFSNFAHVTCGHSLVLLWWRCNMLSTSGFVDDITFSQYGTDGPELSMTLYIDKVHQVEARVGYQTTGVWLNWSPAPAGQNLLSMKALFSVALWWTLQTFLIIPHTSNNIYECVWKQSIYNFAEIPVLILMDYISLKPNSDSNRLEFWPANWSYSDLSKTKTTQNCRL